MFVRKKRNESEESFRCRCQRSGYRCLIRFRNRYRNILPGLFAYKPQKEIDLSTTDTITTTIAIAKDKKRVLPDFNTPYKKLRIRPMYDYQRQRIRTHVLIAFVAYTIYKELERLLSKHRLPISPQRAIELTQTMYELKFELPNDQELQRVPLKMDHEQQLLYDLLC